MEEIESEDKNIQTNLQCYPFYLLRGETANVRSDQAIQTIVTIGPAENNKDIYPRLTYLSAADLFKQLEGIITARRKVKLKFKLPSNEQVLDSDDYLESYNDYEFIEASLQQLINNLPVFADLQAEEEEEEEDDDE